MLKGLSNMLSGRFDDNFSENLLCLPQSIMHEETEMPAKKRKKAAKKSSKKGAKKKGAKKTAKKKKSARRARARAAAPSPAAAEETGMG